MGSAESHSAGGGPRRTLICTLFRNFPASETCYRQLPGCASAHPTISVPPLRPASPSASPRAPCQSAARHPETPRHPSGRFPTHKKPAKTSVLCPKRSSFPSSPPGAGCCDGHQRQAGDAHDAIGVGTCCRFAHPPSREARRSQTWHPNARHPNAGGRPQHPPDAHPRSAWLGRRAPFALR